MLSKSLKLLWAVVTPLSDYPLPKIWGIGVLRWVMHFLMVILVIAFFELLQIKYHFSRFVRAPFPLLREYWLPVFVTFLYLNIWLTWAFLYSLKMKSRYFAFGEIQTKIEFGLNYAASREIDVKTTPIFLMVGQPISGSSHLLKIYSQTFQNFTWKESILLPSFEGIFLNVEENSHLGSLELQLSSSYEGKWKKLFYVNETKPNEGGLQTKSLPQITPNSEKSAVSPETKSAEESGDQDQAKLAVQEAIQAAQSEIQKIFTPSSPIELPLPNAEPAIVLQALEPNPDGNPDAFLQSSKSLGDNSTISQKMNFFMEKLEDIRFPICPINGIAIVIPIPYLTSGNIADILNASQKDLLFIREKFQLNCPVHIFFTDIDRIPGYSSLLGNTIPSKINEPFGIHFQSCLENLTPEDVQLKIKNSVSWVLTEWFPKTIYSFLDFSKSNHVSNMGFLELMSSFWKLEPIITQFSAKLLTPANTKPFLAGGCHFMATGSEIRNQAFSEKAFIKMVEMQNCVSWQKNVFRKDKALLFFTIIGYTFLVSLMVLALYLVWAVILK
ncbi:MAG: type VI secretion protein IcmF/TssM N-terminal domain-containing protein [Planctomycetia bacterium]